MAVLSCVNLVKLTWKYPQNPLRCMILNGIDQESLIHFRRWTRGTAAALGRPSWSDSDRDQCDGSCCCKLALSPPCSSFSCLPSCQPCCLTAARGTQASCWADAQPATYFAISSPVVLLGQRAGPGFPFPCKAQCCRGAGAWPAPSTSSALPLGARILGEAPQALTLTGFLLPSHTH